MNSAQHYPESQPRAERHKGQLGFLGRHYKLAAVVALSVTGWLSIYALTSYHPKFMSDAMVLIKDSAYTSRYVIPDQNYALQTTTSSSANPVLNTMGLLRSDSISNALWTFLLEKHPEHLKRLKIKNRVQWETYYGNGKDFLKTKNEPGTDLIAVRFSWDDPTLAKESLAVVLDSFRQASLELNKSEQRVKSRYIRAQVKQIQKQLEDKRRKKSEFKRQMKVANIAKESDVLAAAGIDMATSLNQVEAKARGKEAEYQRLEGLLGMDQETALTAAAIGQNEKLNKLQSQLYELSQRSAMMRSSLTEKNPKVKEVQAQLEQTQADIRSELKRTLGRALQDSKAPLKDPMSVSDLTRNTVINQMVKAKSESIRLFTEADILRQRMQDIQSQIETLPNIEEALSNLEEEERALSTAFNTLRQKELEAQIKEAETLSNVFIVDPPKQPKSAQFPNQMQLFVLAIMAGATSGVLAAYLKSRWVWMTEFFINPDPEDRQKPPARQNPATDRVIPFPLSPETANLADVPASSDGSVQQPLPSVVMEPAAEPAPPPYWDLPDTNTGRDDFYTDLAPSRDDTVAMLSEPAVVAPPKWQSVQSLGDLPDFSTLIPIEPQPAPMIEEPPVFTVATKNTGKARHTEKKNYVAIPSVIRGLKEKLKTSEGTPYASGPVASPSVPLEVNPERVEKLKNRLLASLQSKSGANHPDQSVRLIYADEQPDQNAG